MVGASGGSVATPLQLIDVTALRQHLARVVARVCPAWLAAQRDDLVQSAVMRLMHLLEGRPSACPPVGPSVAPSVGPSFSSGDAEGGPNFNSGDDPGGPTVTAGDHAVGPTFRSGDREGIPLFSTSYLYKVAHSALVDEIRRVRRRRETDLEDEGVAEIAGTTGNPERIAASLEIGRGIQACLRCMKRERRLAVILHLQGYTVTEAARILDWPAKRTENLVYRGLADLRACLTSKGMRP